MNYQFKMTHILREPGGNEGHVEGVGVGVEGVEAVRLHARHHGPHPAGELAADWGPHGWALRKSLSTYSSLE